MKSTRYLACFAPVLVLVMGLSAPCARAAEATQPADNVPAFYLGTKQQPADPPISPLAGELYRQAMLIAARDGLGLTTRDGSLHEWRGDPPPGITWNFRAIPARVEFFASGGDSVWKERVPENRIWCINIQSQTEKVEALSRGDYIRLLETNEFIGKANAMKRGAPAPADAEARLGKLDELSLFALLRETHALIHSDGESEDRLGVLVRAYANLSQLTRFHWSIENQVFAARALIYAQRMVSNEADSPAAWRHRAYAFAMTGWQGQAIKDLERAQKVGGDAKVPRWVAFIDAFSNYDAQKLTDAAKADPSQAPLASFLAFLAVEHGGSQAETLSAAKAALNANAPTALRVIDAMCNETGPGMLNELVEVGPRMFSTQLGADLEKMPGLPKTVIEQIQNQRRPGGNQAGREIICQALIEQGSPQNDSSDPSWATLGRLIQETTFAHIRRKADLIANQWGVDASDYVAQVQPLIAGHRYKSVIDTYGAMHQPSHAAATEAFNKIPLNELTVAEIPLYWLAGAPMRAKVDKALRDSSDFTAFDADGWIAFNSYDIQGHNLIYDTQVLEKLSPASPVLVCDQILNHWDADKAREFEKSHGAHPWVQLALGTRYTQIGQWKDAQRCLKRFVEMSPDEKSYHALANSYKAQHDDERWLATLNEFLDKTQPVALEHAQVQVEIAEYYMARQQYKQAIPFADEASQTGAAWGLSCAAKAHTGAGDFKEAEALIIEEGEHYSYSPFRWCTWCLQTGHGNRTGAMKAFHDYITSRGGEPSSEDLLQLALVSATEGKNAQAIEALQQRMLTGPGPLTLSHIVIFADESDDTTSRDAALKQLPTVQGEGQTIAFGKELIKGFQAGASLDLKAVDAILEQSAPTSRIPIAELTARYLIKHGRKDAAAAYVKRCYCGYDKYCADNLLVYQTSRDLGLDPLAMERPTTNPAK